MKRGDYHANQENKVMIKPNIHSILRNPQIYTFCKPWFFQTHNLPVKVCAQHLITPGIPFTTATHSRPIRKDLLIRPGSYFRLD